MATDRHRLHIVLDFDGTLTQKDTTAVLGSITGITGIRASLSWDAILKAYLQDYSMHEKSYRPKQDTRKTLAEEAAWLRSLRPIELGSAHRVEEAGVFRGATASTIAALAKDSLNAGHIKLRRGWSDLLKLSETQPPAEVSILSVNWSRTFVRCILSAAASEAAHEQDSTLQPRIDNMSIYANEIEGLGNVEGSNGMLGSAGGIRTSGDKLESLKAMTVGSRPGGYGGMLGGLEHSESTAKEAVTIYIGDSISDLECLAAADVGICVRDEQLGSGQLELAACLKRLGMDVQPIEGANMETLLAKPSIWWAPDLGSIVKVLNRR